MYLPAIWGRHEWTGILGGWSWLKNISMYPQSSQNAMILYSINCSVIFPFIFLLVIKIFFLSYTWLNTYFALKLTVIIEETMVYFSNQVTKLLNLKASTSVASYYFHWTIRPILMIILVNSNFVFPVISVCQTVMTDCLTWWLLLSWDSVRWILISSATGVGNLSSKVHALGLLYRGWPRSPALAARASFCWIWYSWNLIDIRWVIFKYFCKQCSEQVV